MSGGYEYSSGGGKGYGAIEQMDSAPQRSAGRREGGSGKARRKPTGGGPKPGEGDFLYEAGLGCDKDNWCRTTALLCCLVLTTVAVTGWMQTCVPFCGAKVQTTGLWKKAWSNVTIPTDMQSSLDTTVDPCQDFYQFACGGFTEHTAIKGDQVEWAKAWDGVESRISKELRDAVASDKGKAGIFYRSCMDTATIEKLGVEPLQPYLEAIDAIKTHEDLIRVIAMLQKINVAVYFDWQVMADPTEPTRYVFAVLDAGLTLPEPKMYTDDSPEFAHIRKQYTQVVENVLMLTGLTATQAKAAAADAISVETAIAKHTLPSHILRTAKAKHYTMAELDKIAPGLGFPTIMKEFGGAGVVGARTNNILMKDPDFMRGLSDLMTVPTYWAHKAYLRFMVAYGLGSDLSSKFLAQGLQVGHILTGVMHNTPRWRKCYDSVKSNLPDELAKIFVHSHLDKKNIDAAEEMMQNLRNTFKSLIAEEKWMTPATQQVAIQKLENMFIQVGHGKWQDYDFEVEPHQFLNNTNNAKVWIIQRAIERLSKPVDRERWGSMDPTQVDGSYARQVNGVFLPAGLLQEPFFSSSFPDARNYGSVGAVMAHELTHGFDNVGRRYDQNGRLHNWWAPADVVAFKKRADCLKIYYGTFQVDGKNVDGDLTLAENIADNGGIKISYEAFLELEQSKGRPASDSDKQLFFLSWGQTWCSVRVSERKRAVEKRKCV
jgi:putative endopeptidase